MTLWQALAVPHIIIRINHTAMSLTDVCHSQDYDLVNQIWPKPFPIVTKKIMQTLEEYYISGYLAENTDWGWPYNE